MMLRIACLLFLTCALLRGQDDSAAMKQASDAFDQGDLDKAISSFSDALKINPKDVQAYIGRGRVYENKADDDKTNRDKAIADFDQAIALDPKNEKAYFYRADCHYEKGFAGDKAEQQKAIDDYTQAVQLSPNDAEAWRMRGMAWGSMFERQKQVDDDTQAIRVDPKDAAAYNDRAVTYGQLHQFDKALADYTESLKITPDSGTYGNRANLYAQNKDYASAVADYTKAIQIVPNDSDAFEGLAEILATCPDAKVRDGQKALAAATKANDLSHGNDPMVLRTLAAACAETGDFDNAVKWETKYASAFDLPPDHDPRLALYKAHQPYHDDGSAWSN